MANSKLSTGPVLLLGAGKGEATCGILYLGGYLRRHGVDATVRLCDWDQTEAELTASLTQLIRRVKPAVVGISLKWYLHVHRALVIARVVRKLDPKIRVVLGGNSAALWWRELLRFDCIDEVILGDGEVPFLALCRGLEQVPNCARRGGDGDPVKTPFEYVQQEADADVYYSHFDDLFLSELDLSGFSGWVAPGKGCDQSCVYCGGRRAAQRLSFGRPNPFLRPVESVQRDHREIDRHIWQYRYDFPGGSTEYLCDVWPGLTLTGKATTYFLWGVPAKGLVEALSKTFTRVALILDIGCFSESQRLELMKQHLLKPCPTDAALFEAIDDCLKYPNLELEVCGIAGLPLASSRSLGEEHALMQRVLERGCKVGYQRLQSQPGALVTSHAERFGMHSEAVTFDDFHQWFEKRARRGIPMVTFRDDGLERAVRKNCELLDATIAEATARREGGTVTPRTKLATSLLSSRSTTLGAWLGSHRVPSKQASTPVTVLRSDSGAGLACAPTLDERAFNDSMVEPGEAAQAVLTALEVFQKPQSVARGCEQLEAKLGPGGMDELVEMLLSRQFLRRVA